MSSDATTLSGRQEFLAAARQLFAEARDQACLLTRALDPAVFGDASLAETVKQFLLQHQRIRLRVLVAEPQRAVRAPHALLELGRVLSSRVEFRQFADDQPIPAQELLLIDDRSLLERDGPEALEARLSHDPLIARERQRRFDALWDQALPSMELRRQSL